MKTSATAKFVGTSARKTGLVAAMIRGQRATDAQAILSYAGKRASIPVGKVLASAIANAENNHKARPGDLVVDSVIIGPGPTLKRSRARAKGSSSPIRKRTSHITITVSDGKSARTLVPSKPQAADNATGSASATEPTETEPKATDKTEEKK